jgi:hypothetical protein
MGKKPFEEYKFFFSGKIIIKGSAVQSPVHVVLIENENEE